jgi:hypothetical protein
LEGLTAVGGGVLACHICAMSQLKPYRAKIGGQPEFLLMAVHESEFAKTLREILNGRESMKNLGEDIVIDCTLPDGSTQEITIGQAKRDLK